MYAHLINNVRLKSSKIPYQLHAYPIFHLTCFKTIIIFLIQYLKFILYFKIRTFVCAIFAILKYIFY